MICYENISKILKRFSLLDYVKKKYFQFLEKKQTLSISVVTWYMYSRYNGLLDVSDCFYCT